MLKYNIFNGNVDVGRALSRNMLVVLDETILRKFNSLADYVYFIYIDIEYIYIYI
jgi:hypothetical protein